MFIDATCDIASGLPLFLRVSLKKWEWPGDKAGYIWEYRIEGTRSMCMGV